MTDTADHADIVLPATTQLEHLDVHISYGHTYAMFNEPAIAPLGEAKPNSQIFRELARRMGFDEPCFADDDETLARTALPGVDFDALRHDGWVKLPLPDAPFEYAAMEKIARSKTVIGVSVKWLPKAYNTHPQTTLSDKSSGSAFSRCGSLS